MSEETGTNIPENCAAGRMAMIAAAKIAAVWRAREHRDQQAEPGARQHIDDAAEHERRQAALDRDLEQQDRERHEGGKLDERDGEIGQLLAEQKLGLGRRCGVEVGDGAQLLLAHHAQAVSMLGISMSSSMMSPGTMA